MAHGVERGYAPARTPSYCAGGDYGSAEAPRTLIQVNSHRRHHKTAGCDQPPMIRTTAGTWQQAEDSTRLTAQVASAAGAPASLAPESPDEPAGGEPQTVDPFGGAGDPADLRHQDPGPSAPRIGTGKAIIPPPLTAPDPPPVMFQSSKPISFEPAIWELYSWARQEGFNGTPDECFAQAIKGYFLLRFGVGITARQVDPRPLLYSLLRSYEVAA